MRRRAILISRFGLITLIAALALVVGPTRAAPGHLGDHVDIHMPETADGPVPAVVMLSGCGGVRQVQSDYAEIANAQGWAAVIVDSHAARGIGRFGARAFVCTALRMRGQERAEDVFAVLTRLRADERFDAERFALIGWSHGGWTALDALALAEAGEAGETALSGVRGVFLLYPYCGTLTKADRYPIGEDIRVTVVIAGRDRVVSASACRRLVQARRAEGSRIEALEEPELTHAFDAEDQPWDPRMRFDREGADRALGRFSAFLTALEG